MGRLPARRLRYAAASNVTLARNVPHQFAMSHALSIYPSDAVYTYIPKCACSTFRLALAIVNGCVPDASHHRWVHANNPTFRCTLGEAVRARFTFAVVRDPLDRLASAYLDKIVGREPPMWTLAGTMDEPVEPDEMTFDWFVRAACQPRLQTVDYHWRPQVQFLLYERYDLLVPLERLQEFIPAIEARSGLTVQDTRSLFGHGNDRYATIDDGCFARTPPAELAAMRRAGQSPGHRSLYDEGLAALARRVYAEDISLHRSALENEPPTDR